VRLERNDLDRAEGYALTAQHDLAALTIDTHEDGGALGQLPRGLALECGGCVEFLEDTA
jgi:hypothetical protein